VLLPGWCSQGCAGRNKIWHVIGVGSVCGSRPIRRYVYVLGVTPWATGLLGKLMVSELYKKFPTFYATRIFIADFTKDCQGILF